MALPSSPQSPTLTPQLEAQLRDMELKTKVDNMFRSASDSRRRYDWEWLVRDLYRRGYHFSRYNPTSKTVVLASRSQVKVPINLVHSQMRVIRNQVTSFRPKFEVIPTGGSQEAEMNSRYSQKLLDYYYERNRLRKKIKETITQGLITSVGGPWQIGYDPNADGGKGDVYIWILDPFDFYVDPKATSVEDAEFCIKAVRKPINEIKANPEYTFETPLDRGETRVAASEYKQFLIMALKQINQQGSEPEEDGAILKETWMKVRVTTENVSELSKELKKNDQDNKDLIEGEVLMRVVTTLDYMQKPLRVQLLRRSDYPFVMYQADINPVELYGESWIKHVIPPNRVLDALESSTFEYNYLFAKGRIVIDKNSGVRIIANQHGQFIEKNPGSTVTSMVINPLPPSYDIQTQNMRRYIEDLGGAHDVSLGRIPTGVRSGVGIAEMKAADATNQADLVDNLEDFLCEVAKKILKEIAVNFDVPKMVHVLGKGGSADHFAVVGQSGKNRKSKKIKIGTDVFDIAVIGADNEVRVSIGSWLAYTKSAQFDKLKELFEAGLIDQQTFLENAEFPDVTSIVERTRKDAIMEKFRGTPAGEGQVSDEEIAQQENFQMTNENKQVEALPEDNHEIHIIVHEEALGINGNPNVEEHIAQHEEMLRSQVVGVRPASPEPPTEPIPEDLPGFPDQAGGGMMPPGAMEGGMPQLPPELMGGA